MPSILPSEIVRVIDDRFRWAAFPFKVPHVSGTDAPRVAAIVSLADRLPASLVQLKPGDLVRYLTALEELRALVKIITSRGEAPSIDGHLILTLRSLLAECPDEAANDAYNSLSFIDDAVLRRDIQLDATEADASLNDGRWKAATVLSGSAIEALLTWRLSRLGAAELVAAVEGAIHEKGKRPREPEPETWFLWQLIAVSHHAKLIVDDTFTACKLAQNYRNLIHPGKAMRAQERCGKDTALGALSALERVIQDVQRGAQS